MKLIENLTKIFIILGSIIITLAVLLFLWNETSTLSISNQINSEKFAQIGDFIGGIVGTLWALAGVLLFYLALREQRKDIQINQETLKTQITALNQQIKEFRLQTEELEQTRNVFQEQSKTLRVQTFENTFFQLLLLNQEIVDKLWLDVGNNVNLVNGSQVEKRE